MYIVSPGRFAAVILSNFSGLHKKAFPWSFCPFLFPLQLEVEWINCSAFLKWKGKISALCERDLYFCYLPFILNQCELVSPLDIMSLESPPLPLMRCTNSRPVNQHVELSRWAMVSNRPVRNEADISFSSNWWLFLYLVKRETIYWIFQTSNLLKVYSPWKHFHQ